MDAKDVTPEMHDEFYRFIGTSYDRPRFTLHYKTDAPLTLRALLYFPEGKPGMQILVTGFSCTVRPFSISEVTPSVQTCVFTTAFERSTVLSAGTRTVVSLAPNMLNQRSSLLACPELGSNEVRGGGIPPPVHIYSTQHYLEDP
jgi:hypothetical protein